jgi:hypothetical protein
MRIVSKILAIWGGFAAVILLVIVVRYMMDVEISHGANVKHYNAASLIKMGLPEWHLTNTVPITPDKAILSAFGYATTKHPSITHWDVDQIELIRENYDIWTYHIFLTDRISGHYEVEDVRVLMNGSVWEPTSMKH